MAEAMYKLHGAVHLISIVGNDQNGAYLKSLLPGQRASALHTDANRSTGSFAIVLDRTGDSRLLLGDMDIHAGITPKLILENEPLIAAAPIVVMDANLRLDTMEALLSLCQKYNVPVFFEPTDMRRAHLPFTLPAALTGQIKYTSPNIHELHVIAAALGRKEDTSSHLADMTTSDDPEGLRRIGEVAAFVQQHIDTVLVTMGSLGVLVASRRDDNGSTSSSSSVVRFYAAQTVPDIVNVSGAGDSFASGFVTAMIAGRPEAVCVSVGFAAAAAALRSRGAVPESYGTVAVGEGEAAQFITIR